ncbi:YggS family pyridoxal phosphate-dependent enzyme [Paraneptunicella aestuarii]|uniref:YggS family pyridoxal phosphate-dependent enzyme n=1 Tax=Paraneptunicella aestuarii TaxID=2831148 RepID=UPI001E61CA56|nr:YggS family pyridoxal phosphate-dependent enzyme [Paraneptunicella aestuarii]UAA39785.1 YggS family pyridoxal phosphate-dependent enzyme [Paraneptunicella aestuarii]
MLTIANRLKSALDTIQDSALKAGRNPQEILLLAVSKTKPNQAIREAWNAGQRMFGENYVQEGIQKIADLSDLEGIQWHMIGPLQSNKTKVVAEHFDWVQSVDRAKIAERLNEQRPEDLAPLQVCIQVNISDEDSKSGLLPEEVMPLAETISQLPRLNLRGLMAIPAATESEQEQRFAFTQMQDLYHQLKQKYPQVDTLSMGMSGDVDMAIACGSTMVRIGTAIFGARDYPASQG